MSVVLRLLSRVPEPQGRCRRIDRTSDEINWTRVDDGWRQFDPKTCKRRECGVLQNQRMAK